VIRETLLRAARDASRVGTTGHTGEHGRQHGASDDLVSDSSRGDAKEE
jgi:hypothetical protein